MYISSEDKILFMRRHIETAKSLVFSSTAKDTYILFIGNVASAFLGFVYTLLVARALSVSDFGVFSAATNLVYILVSVGDLGISSGAVNFIADAYSKGQTKLKEAYMKSSLIIRSSFMSLLAILMVVLATLISEKFLATTDISISFWVAAVTWVYLLSTTFSFFLQAERKFLKSTILDIVLNIFRVFLTYLFILSSGLTLSESLFSFAIACVVTSIFGIIYVKPGFLFAKVDKSIHVDLLKFSGWLGVNRVLSTISGRLDVQMLAAISGAVLTGFYSISSKISFFIVVLAGSFGAVLAPRLASFSDKHKERKYLAKATLMTLPIVAGVIIWIIIAKPFILLLFGEKYLQSVPIFQALSFSYIPFILTIPSVTAIIYSIKKPKLIGVFSIFNLIAIFFLNLILIPKFSIFGPVITFGVTNSIMAIFSWIIVIKYYWRS